MARRLNPMMVAVAVLAATWALPAANAVAAGGSGAGSRLKAALAQLDLSAQQKVQIKQIMATAKPQAGAAAAGGQRRAIMKQVMAVLTHPQKRKLIQILKASRSHGTAAT